jgi:regulatory protein
MKKPKTAYSKAIELLARREHSVRELTQKLLQREFEQEEIDAAIARLLESKYLDNTRFIGCLIRARVAQGAGPAKIKAQLLSHDISSAHIENHEQWQQTNWLVLARQAKVKRFGELPPADHKAKAKQIQFLTRRGFSTSQASTAISGPYELSFFDESS